MVRGTTWEPTPHSGLQGATPADAYLGLDSPHIAAVQPPRGRRGDAPVPSPATLAHFEDDNRLPLLRKIA